MASLKDSIITGDLRVTGSTYSTGVEATTINGVTVGSSPKFTDTVTRVKGNSESSYRSGDVNLTAANIGAAASSHTHGNIQNGGTLQTNDVAIASGDKLVITDSSDSAKVARASLSFDGSTTTQFLSKKGTWEEAGGGVDIDTVYPVGSIYMSTNSTNPGTLFGVGTWEQISDTFLLAAGSTYAAGTTGGSASHNHSFTGSAVTSGDSSAANTGSTAITENQTASHRHYITMNYSGGAGGGGWLYLDLNGGSARYTNYTGGSQGHTHSMSHTHSVTASGSVGSKTTLPPYLAVYVWKRTA